VAHYLIGSSLLFRIRTPRPRGHLGWFPVVCTTLWGMRSRIILFRTGRIRWCILFSFSSLGHCYLFQVAIPPLGIEFFSPVPNSIVSRASLRLSPEAGRPRLDNPSSPAFTAHRRHIPKHSMDASQIRTPVATSSRLLLSRASIGADEASQRRPRDMAAHLGIDRARKAGPQTSSMSTERTSSRRPLRAAATGPG